MNYLENFYSNYDEESRLLGQHGQVEYLTTMKYIHEVLGEAQGQRILEVGAGTGRYSIALAKEGYQVDALELTEHNLGILKERAEGLKNICAKQGTALDLSSYSDESFDATLVLGPLYHLYTQEDRIQALREAIRVTKKDGYIFVAYCMNESVIIQEEFIGGALKKDLAAHRISEDFHCISKPEDLFVMMRIEEIYELTKELPVERVKIIASDGAATYMRETIDSFDKETFQQFLKYHFTVCERLDIIGATNHSLDILKKGKLL